MKRILSILICTFLLSMTVFPLCSLAEEPYYYRVRVYSGEQGVIDGQESVTYENLDESYRVNFNVGGTVSIAQIVDGKQMKPVKEYQVTDIDASKYYIKGLREAGKDNTEILASHPIKQDMDYVIAYGMLGDSVDYTIRYVDANGNALLDDQTYYGNVGDRPVVAYQYIDGYQPQAYNITRTLTANPEENVLTFTYTPIPEPENTVNTTINTTTTTIPSTTGTGTTGGTTGGTAGGTVAPSTTGGTAQTNTAAGNTGTTGTAANANTNRSTGTGTATTGTGGTTATTPCSLATGRWKSPTPTAP